MPQQQQQPEYETMTVTEASRHPRRLVGWWTSADGTAQLDMTGKTVEGALDVMIARADGDNAQLDVIFSGTIEVESDRAWAGRLGRAAGLVIGNLKKIIPDPLDELEAMLLAGDEERW